MEGFKFMAEMGASMASERLASVAEQAREQARLASELAHQRAQEAAARVHSRASEMATMANNIDITKIKDISVSDVYASADSLRESATKSVSVLGATVTSVAAGEWSGAAAGGGRPPTSQEDGGSESGGDDYSSSGWSISRIGLGGARNPEKQGLIPKRDVEAGGGGCSSPLGGLSSAPWSALQTVRDYGVAGVTTVGSTIGLVEKPKVPETRLEKLCRCCPTLTYKQRLLGFGFCFFFGVSLSLSALNSLPSLLLGNPAPFAFKYTLGNLLAIGSSSFLVGPVKQFQDMAAPERRTASLVYVSSLCATLLSVFVLKWQLVSFVLVVIQFGALTWYMLSYVPYGQQIFKRFLSRLM